jgi:uncharacterized damage-inducible protein DinB
VAAAGAAPSGTVDGGRRAAAAVGCSGAVHAAWEHHCRGRANGDMSVPAMRSRHGRRHGTVLADLDREATTMPELSTHLRSMAAYNRWANRRLYAAAAALPDGDYRRPTGVFFGSLHGTLNHLLVTDRLWMHRMTGTGDAPDKLNAILFDDLGELRAAREREDERIIGHVAGLSAAELEADFQYATTKGVPQRQPRWEALAHLFNHQTHHRGQVHALLTRAGESTGATDLPFVL